MLNFLTISTIAFSILSTLTVNAQEAKKSEQDACERDVLRLCRKVIDQGDFAILACLKEKRARISGVCDKVLKTHGQ
jgi:hypothetical protein